MMDWIENNVLTCPFKNKIKYLEINGCDSNVPLEEDRIRPCFKDFLSTFPQLTHFKLGVHPQNVKARVKT